MIKILLLLLFVWLLITLQTGKTRTVDSHLRASDVARYRDLFINGLALNNLQAIYYSSLNVKPSDIKNKDALCKRILSIHSESALNDFEKDYFLIGAHKNAECKQSLPTALSSKLPAILSQDDATAQQLFYRTMAHKMLGLKMDDATTDKIITRLRNAINKDGSFASLGYAFHLAAELKPKAAFVVDRIEDAVMQADEVGGTTLQFEGGTSATALVVNGLGRFSAAYNKPAPFSASQAEKFVTYFLKRRTVLTPEGAHHVVESLKTLAAMETVAPICVQLIGNGQLHESLPVLSVTVVDILGKALVKTPTKVHGTINSKDSKSFTAKQIEFASKSSDNTVYAADLSAMKLTRGLYKIDVNVDGVYEQRLTFKILGKVKVDSMEIGVGDADASRTIKKQTVPYPNALQETLAADSTQKLVFKVKLIEESIGGKPITVQQAFVHLKHKDTDEEIIFIAEQNDANVYKFDLDVGTRGSNFGYKSGLYGIYLTIGDSSISNSFSSHVANVQLKFAQEAIETKKTGRRTLLPEIHHQFRTPEKRPVRIVSDIFTGLCVMPLLLLFVLWWRLGINVSNFSFAPSTLGFHAGFGGILALFVLFWLQLNMFQTLRMLIPLAAFTFLCGNQMLRRMHAQRVTKNPTS